jgi:hypothetical protein
MPALPNDYNVTYTATEPYHNLVIFDYETGTPIPDNYDFTAVFDCRNFDFGPIDGSTFTLYIVNNGDEGNGLIVHYWHNTDLFFNVVDIHNNQLAAFCIGDAWSPNIDSAYLKIVKVNDVVTFYDLEGNNLGSVTIGTSTVGLASLLGFGQLQDGFSGLVDVSITHTPQNYVVTVESALGGYTNPAVGTYTILEGTEQTVTAVPYEGYVFLDWSNSEVSNPYTFTVTGDLSIAPIFDFATATGLTVFDKAIQKLEQQTPDNLFDVALQQFERQASVNWFDRAINLYEQVNPTETSVVFYTPIFDDEIFEEYV